MKRLVYIPTEERLKAVGIPAQRRGAVAMRYANGWTVKEIAADLRIAEPTVKANITYLRERTGVANACELLLLLLGFLDEGDGAA